MKKQQNKGKIVSGLIFSPQAYYGFSQLRTERPKQTTTRYAGARRKLYKKIPQVVQ